MLVARVALERMRDHDAARTWRRDRNLCGSHAQPAAEGLQRPDSAIALRRCWLTAARVCPRSSTTRDRAGIDNRRFGGKSAENARASIENGEDSLDTAPVLQFD